MALSVSLSAVTASDATFSAAGATAWLTVKDRTATLAGVASEAQGGTGVAALGSGVATWLETPSSANLAAAVTGETGTGALVFATSPALVTPALGTPASGVATNMTGLTYGLQFGATAYNPTDAQTTYHGLGGTVSTVAAVYTVPVAKAGTITDVFVDIGVAGTLGTTEQATISIGVNNASYTTISAVAQFNAARQQYSITGQAVVVAAGDFLQLRCANPTWVTNPTGVNLSGSVIVRTT